MATPTKIQFNPAKHGLYATKRSPQDAEAAAKKISQVLQQNHDRAHIVNVEMLHNHIVHDLATNYALGASEDELQLAYDCNQYQLPIVPVHAEAQDMANPETFKKCLGKDEYYSDFLVFFQREMEKSSWEDVLQEYLFKGDERAEDLLVRAFAGYLHPMIHMAFGIEFEQPAIVAEGLAMAAIHLDWPGALLLPAEQAAASVHKKKRFIDLVNELRNDDKLKDATGFNEFGFKSLLLKEPLREELVKVVCQYKVDGSQMEAELADFYQAVAFICGGAQRPPKEVKIDFLMMHCMNFSLLINAFLNLPWLSAASKVRLVEWTGRLSLGLYVGCNLAPLYLDEIKNYEPLQPTAEDGDVWKSLFHRAASIPDDGHIAKMLRALAYGQKICAPYEEKMDFVIKGKMWETIGHMTMDSTDVGSSEWKPEDGIWSIFSISNYRWVRGAGFPERWTQFRDRDTPREARTVEILNKERSL